MDSRLFKISINEEQWSVCGSRYSNNYRLCNNETFASLNITGEIIGIEQIYDDTFLIHRRAEKYRNQILRIKVSESGTLVEYNKIFTKFEFLTDDVILFDNVCVYSISEGKELEGFEWLKNCSISVLRDDKDPSKKIMFVEKCVCSSNINNEFVQVAVDTTTFKPVSKAYSTLRNTYFDLSDSFTFSDLAAEDTNYAKIIDWFFLNLSIAIRTEGKKSILESLI